MLRRLTFVAITISGLTGSAFAQVVVSGVVKDELNAAVRGAIVTLKGTPTSVDTTDALGAYTLMGNSGVAHGFSSMRTTPAWILNRDALVLSIDKAAPTTVECFRLNGARSAVLVNQTLEPGVHRFSLNRRAAEFALVRIRIGRTTTTIQAYSSASTEPQSLFREGDGSLSKTAAAPDSLIITHPYYARYAANVASTPATVNATLTYTRLNSGEYFRVLVPNGGESYAYDVDTMTVAWLQDVTSGVSSAGVVSMSRNSGLFFCDLPSSETVWNKYPRDKDSTGYKSYKLIDASKNLVIGFYKIPVKDDPVRFWLCSPPTFQGTAMMVKVWEPYPAVPYTSAQLNDKSDATFAVVGHP